MVPSKNVFCGVEVLDGLVGVVLFRVVAFPVDVVEDFLSRHVRSSPRVSLV